MTCCDQWNCVEFYVSMNLKLYILLIGVAICSAIPLSKNEPLLVLEISNDYGKIRLETNGTILVSPLYNPITNSNTNSISDIGTGL